VPAPPTTGPSSSAWAELFVEHAEPEANGVLIFFHNLYRARSERRANFLLSRSTRTSIFVSMMAS